MHHLIGVFFYLLLIALGATAHAENYRIEVVTGGLEQPWSLAFLPDGRLLISERPGRLRLYSNNKLGPALTGVPATFAKSQGGFFDVLPHPDFADNALVYLSYAEGDDDENTLAIGRGRLSDDALLDFEVLFRVSPMKATPVHYGGRMAWLADGTLIVTTGDGFNYREQAQSLTSQMGKTLRMTADGQAPPDNPFAAGGGDPYVYTYGHRNPQGLARDPGSGALWLHEHGPRGGDEINLLRPGRNYGWPAVTFGLDYSGAIVSPFTEAPGLEPPLLHWTPSIAPSGLMIYRGDAFPGWQGSLFAGALVEKSVRRVVFRDNYVVSEEILFREPAKRIRDVREGPDGFIYLLTGTGKGELLRVVPAP